MISAVTLCFYFGAWSKEQSGHFLYAPGGHSSRRNEKVLPFKHHILDAGLLPDSEKQEQGVVYRSLINGWTILTFWGRSCDERFSSNSAFIINADISTEEGLRIAKEKFPERWAKFGFNLRS